MKIIGNLIGYLLVLLAILYVLAIPALLVANIWTGDSRYGKTGGVLACILVLVAMAGWYIYDRASSGKAKNDGRNIRL